MRVCRIMFCFFLNTKKKFFLLPPFLGRVKRDGDVKMWSYRNVSSKEGKKIFQSVGRGEKKRRKFKKKRERKIFPPLFFWWFVVCSESMDPPPIQR